MLSLKTAFESLSLEDQERSKCLKEGEPHLNHELLVSDELNCHEFYVIIVFQFHAIIIINSSLTVILKSGLNPKGA